MIDRDALLLLLVAVAAGVILWRIDRLDGEMRRIWSDLRDRRPPLAETEIRR